MSREVKQKLSTISRSAVERLLSKERKKHKLKEKSTTKKGTLLKNQIPLRVFWAWDKRKPGFCEIDTVSHDNQLPLRLDCLCDRCSLNMDLSQGAQKQGAEMDDGSRHGHL